jgi:DNA-binding response OmpR family regulator
MTCCMAAIGYPRMHDVPVSRATVLVVEDDPSMVTMLTDVLELRGYCIHSAASAAEAARILDEVEPDLILLDLSLPDMSGLVLCANLREKTEAPIIVCSATKQQDDRILGFKLGADDFVSKPFSVDELAARIEAVLRRATPRASTQLHSRPEHQEIGPLLVDEARCQVTLSGKELHLTPTEYRLLCVLVSRAGEVLSRKELAERVWGYHDPDVGRTLDVHMRRLRTKLNAGAAAEVQILTLRGFGYRLLHEPQGSAVR